MNIKITRAGCLAVHLMPKYHGRKLSNAVKRIMESGPRDEYEREAVRLANADNVEAPKIPTTNRSATEAAERIDELEAASGDGSEGAKFIRGLLNNYRPCMYQPDAKPILMGDESDHKRLIAAADRLDALEAEVQRFQHAVGFALAHITELRGAWQRGALQDHDGQGGTRSNMNVDVEMKLRAALGATAQEGGAG